MQQLIFKFKHTNVLWKIYFKDGRINDNITEKIFVKIIFFLFTLYLAFMCTVYVQNSMISDKSFARNNEK